MAEVFESAEAFIARQSARWEAARDRPLRFKDIGRQGWHTWYREAWTFRKQRNYPVKVLVIERLRRGEFIGSKHHKEWSTPVGDIEYRLGYYIVGAIGRTAGRWRWGQYAQLIPHNDFLTLIAKARSDGTILEASTVILPKGERTVRPIDVALPKGERTVRPLPQAEADAALERVRKVLEREGQ